ncbi:hypothetical protein EXIGLDRAFT_504331 [Exidia glandulosa HHB12029]|uniref:Uncharacterized protein n=1 Tax=Exidia glandulosa HHB12029 TaxID=1314781 RepID=A0A165Z2C7_EXIGL|nr:hypothetical protein EXIGLDRAFT_504331 [Exidia glandulosa HHB12029]
MSVVGPSFALPVAARSRHVDTCLHGDSGRMISVDGLQALLKSAAEINCVTPAKIRSLVPPAPMGTWLNKTAVAFIFSEVLSTHPRHGRGRHPPHGQQPRLPRPKRHPARRVAHGRVARVGRRLDETRGRMHDPQEAVHGAHVVAMDLDGSRGREGGPSRGIRGLRSRWGLRLLTAAWAVG